MTPNTTAKQQRIQSAPNAPQPHLSGYGKQFVIDNYYHSFDRIPSSLLVQILIDAADHCPTCRAQLDHFITH